MRSALVTLQPCGVADLIEAGLNEAAGRFCAMGIVALAPA